MLILRLLLILCAISFILVQRVDIKVINDEKLTVKISLNLFAILLTEDKIKRIRFKKVRGIIRNFYGITRSFKFLIPRTDVMITEYESYSAIENEYNPTNPWHILAPSKFIISFLEANARSFEVNRICDRTVVLPIDKKHFDIYFHFSLLNMIISALILLYYIVKKQLKRVIKNV